MEGSKQDNCFPWHKLDDLIIFFMIMVLIFVMSYKGYWDLVQNLTSGLFGALMVYIKGGKG